MLRKHRHTVRLSDGEEDVAKIVMQALECKSIPEMFRSLLDHTQMPDDIEKIKGTRLSARPPIWMYALRVTERDRARGVLRCIKDAIHKINS